MQVFLILQLIVSFSWKIPGLVSMPVVEGNQQQIAASDFHSVSVSTAYNRPPELV